MFNYSLITLIILLIFPLGASEKLIVVTHSYDRADFLELQNLTFKKFLVDDYEFVVMNDAPNEFLSNQIEAICQQQKIRTIRIPQDIHANRGNPTEGVVDTIQFSLNNYWFDYDGIVVLVDSDLFLIKSFSILEFLKGYDLSGHKQQRPLIGDPLVTYLWQGLIFMDMRTLPNKKSMNFDCGIINGQPVDGGGKLYYYLEANPSLKVKYYSEPTPDAAGVQIMNLPDSEEILKELGYEDPLIDLILKYKKFHDPYSMELHLNNTFLHYRGGGNWIQKPLSYHVEKSNILKDFINKL